MKVGQRWTSKRLNEAEDTPTQKYLAMPFLIILAILALFFVGYLVVSLIAMLLYITVPIVFVALITKMCLSIFRHCRGTALLDVTRSLPRQSTPDTNESYYCVVSALCAYGHMTLEQLNGQLAKMGIPQMITVNAVNELLGNRFVRKVGVYYYPTQLGVQFAYNAAQRGAFTPPIFDPTGPFLTGPDRLIDALRSSTQEDPPRRVTELQPITFDID